MIVEPKICLNAGRYSWLNLSLLILQMRTWIRSASEGRELVSRHDSHRNSFVRLRVLVIFDVESIKRHESNSTTLVLNHSIEDDSSRLIIIDNDLEETVRTFEKMSERQREVVNESLTSFQRSPQLQSCIDLRPRTTRTELHSIHQDPIVQRYS